MASHKNGWWFVIRCSLNAIHSRTRRLERSLIRNPQNPQSPKLPLYKEILQILPKLQKKIEETKIKHNIFWGEFRSSGVAVVQTSLAASRENVAASHLSSLTSHLSLLTSHLSLLNTYAIPLSHQMAMHPETCRSRSGTVGLARCGTSQTPFRHGGRLLRGLRSRHQ